MREEVTDRYGNVIYLTDERWQHIVKNHFKLNGHRAEVLSTVRSGKRKQDPKFLDMNLSYDPEGDLLEVIFDESRHQAEQIPFRLRDGLMLFVTADSMKPVQLTIVNYLGLAQLPMFHFNGWKKLKATERKKLLPIINSPAVSAFLKLDPETGYGHLASPPMLEMFSLAA